MRNTINGRDLIKAGYKEGEILGLALKTAETLKIRSKKDKILFLRKVKLYPESYLDDEYAGPLAKSMVAERVRPQPFDIPLLAEAPPYNVYGASFIEDGARDQMAIAMRLPITVSGALMPDAHQGYGLPIGGVLATRDVVIPYGVGVDIGCRMALTVFDLPATYLDANRKSLQKTILASTRFGAGQAFTGSNRADHSVLESPAFNSSPFLRSLKDKAYAQLGTSGGGNHFVEWGVIDFDTDDKALNVPVGSYLALLTHSGSRGFGATIAGHFTKLAKEACRLPKEAANLAYLELSSQTGHEYWKAMSLAGDYASACHEIIHEKMIRAVGGQVLTKVENHHNFAWKEQWNGQEVIVHRKGATPAGKGVMGIIPGSMTAPGFLVRGRGEAGSINSASHGAGRLMSRTKAIQTITNSDLKAILRDNDVTLLGAGLDEAPMAYKDINGVMEAQSGLVDIIAKFAPKIVRMADDGSRED